MINKKPIFISACMGVLIFGAVLAMLGAVLPSVIEKFGIGKAGAGSLFLMLSFGILAGSIVFGPVVDRYGYKGLLILSTFLVFASLQGIALSPSVNMLRISLFAAGFAGGSINGSTNALVSETSIENRGASLTLLSVFFGIGALGVPLLLGSLLDRFTYESLIGFIGVLFIIPLIFFAFVRFPYPKHAQGFPVADVLRLTNDTRLLMLGLILFMQSGLEMTIGGWSAAFLNEELKVQPRQSVLLLSFFWLGLILARLALSKILHYVSKYKIMLISFSAAFAGMVMLLLSREPLMAIAGLMLTGIGFAAVFPLVFAFVGDLYPEFSGTALGVVLTIALPGGMIYPYLTGFMAENLNLRVSLLLIPLTLIASTMLFLKTGKRISRN
jgi:MFS transporter, FHS family, glucose/mannose:H+ symporter